MGYSATLINQTSYQGVWLRPSLKSQVTNNLPLLRLQWHCTQRTLESITWCWLWENIGRVAMLRSPHPMTNNSCQRQARCHLGREHLGVIFTAFFVPWLDWWQGHSGWIVEWPPEKALNLLRPPCPPLLNPLLTHLISRQCPFKKLVSAKHEAFSPCVRLKAFVPAQNHHQGSMPSSDL